MDLTYSDEHTALQTEVRQFIAEYGERSPKVGGGRKRPDQQALDWQTRLLERGYFGRTIAREFGGYGAEPDILEAAIIAEAFSSAGISPGIMNQGISMLVPTLLEVGTEAQCRRWVEPTIRGEIIWCQGYSEPGAGSDLASLRTKAHVEDGRFVINGQKIWTSSAHFADMIFILVRTEPEQPKRVDWNLGPGTEYRPEQHVEHSMRIQEFVSQRPIAQRVTRRRSKIEPLILEVDPEANPVQTNRDDRDADEPRRAP